MRIAIILTGLAMFGCASAPVELTQAEKDLNFFYDEPKVAYEELGPVNTTTPGKNAMDALNKIRSRAVELGANGIIVHAVHNKGTVAGGSDEFGTGGGGGFVVYQIQATAIRYEE